MESLQELARRFASRGLLIDTNLLLLYAIGLYDRVFVSRFKRTQKYTLDDFDLVRDLAVSFGRVVTTPHILAELSNLAIAGTDASRRPYFPVLLNVLENAHEMYVEKDAIVHAESFPKLGYTDTAIIELAIREKYLVFTDDFPLAGSLEAFGCHVVNLNHIRTAHWFRKR